MKDIALTFILAALMLVSGPSLFNAFTGFSPKYQQLEIENQQLKQTARDYDVYREAIKDAR
jgi:hypothetical protein